MSAVSHSLGLTRRAFNQTAAAFVSPLPALTAVAPSGALPQAVQKAILILFNDGERRGLVHEIIGGFLGVSELSPKRRAFLLTEAYQRRLNSLLEAKAALNVLINHAGVPQVYQDDLHDSTNPKKLTWQNWLKEHVPNAKRCEIDFLTSTNTLPGFPWPSALEVWGFGAAADKEQARIELELNSLPLGEPIRKIVMDRITKIRRDLELGVCDGVQDKPESTRDRRVKLLEQLYGGPLMLDMYESLLSHSHHP
jgi:hypothetical protein